jgi:hypothetical protein
LLSEKTTLIILWHIDPLLGNDHATNNKTMAIARQQLHKSATVLEIQVTNVYQVPNITATAR